MIWKDIDQNKPAFVKPEPIMSVKREGGLFKLYFRKNNGNQLN